MKFDYSFYKFKLTVLFAIVVLIAFTLVNWYIGIGKENIEKLTHKQTLSHDDAKNIANNYKPEREYYYDITYVEKKTRTLVPFVYEKDTISNIKKKLMSIPR